MPNQFPNEIGKPDVTDVASRGSTAEQELVAAAKRGDEGAFETLFNHHQRRIFALALRYTRVREDAEDIVQQTFQQAFVYLQKFEGKSSFSTWVTRIAINQALMLLRRRRALSEVPIDDPSSSLETRPAVELADAVPDPEATCIQREKAEILSAAMRQLRPGVREAIELRELGELSNRDTAAHIGVSIGTVKARVFHARRKLAKALRHHMRPRRICASDILAISGNANRSPQNRMTCNA
jgi:RNA polymerase sigma-70 factor (ECF subfamily)